MSFAASYKASLLDTLEHLDTGDVDRAIEWFNEAREEGRRIFVCGNGGSAASASHLVCDVLKGGSYQKAKRFKIMALADQRETVTAYANDVGYDSIFVEQLRNFAEPGDLLLALSGSGNSPNVLRAMEFAVEHGMRTIAMTGRDGGKLGPMAQINIHIPVPHMGRIEDAHMIACHMIAYSFMEQ